MTKLVHLKENKIRRVFTSKPKEIKGNFKLFHNKLS